MHCIVLIGLGYDVVIRTDESEVDEPTTVTFTVIICSYVLIIII